MAELVSFLRVLHVINAILMAWPFYALVTVNQRARLGPPLGDRADVYMENIIRNRSIPCFVFQGTALVTGLALMLLRGLGWEGLFAKAGNPVPADTAAQIGALRLRRKRLASICIFVVLTVSMLGVQVWTVFPLWLTLLLVVVIATFVWRGYSSVTPYGWV